MERAKSTNIGPLPCQGRRGSAHPCRGTTSFRQAPRPGSGTCVPAVPRGAAHAACFPDVSSPVLSLAPPLGPCAGAVLTPPRADRPLAPGFDSSVEPEHSWGRPDLAYAPSNTYRTTCPVRFESTRTVASHPAPAAVITEALSTDLPLAGKN